mgnify:CR=1 FL=1
MPPTEPRAVPPVWNEIWLAVSDVQFRRADWPAALTETRSPALTPLAKVPLPFWSTEKTVVLEAFSAVKDAPEEASQEARCVPPVRR